MTATALARFDLTMLPEEKERVSCAAALMGVTMAAFVRSAANEKAGELLDRESRVTLTTRDFQAFTSALNSAFLPNAALQQAIDAADKVRCV